MTTVERLQQIATKVINQADAIQTEEGAKNAFVMPFISSVLGYDIFNPMEVVPEFTADVGTKKGEKVDYAIMKDGEVQILIECKTPKLPLNLENASQLFRYFSVTNARIAVLTNGVEWKFFTDLDAPNRMDEKPYLILDMKDVDETIIDEIQKLSKESFDLDSILNAAEELKYVGQLKRVLSSEFKEPTDDFVKYLTTRVYEGSYVRRIREQFTGLVTKACRQFLNDQVNDRLKSALSAADVGVAEPHSSEISVTSEGPALEAIMDNGGIETTEEEREGYQIVKAIACAEVSPQRIAQRDSKSYFAIFLDDNNRKPIARLHFNGKSQKYLGLFDENKQETRHPIDSLESIYRFADDIRAAVRRYENGS